MWWIVSGICRWKMNSICVLSWTMDFFLYVFGNDLKRCEEKLHNAKFLIFDPFLSWSFRCQIIIKSLTSHHEVIEFFLNPLNCWPKNKFFSKTKKNWFKKLHLTEIHEYFRQKIYMQNFRKRKSSKIH